MPLDARDATGYEPADASTAFFRPATAEDIPLVAEIEQCSYPADEAASPDALAYRQAHAGEFFLVGVAASEESPGEDEIVSYVCGTLTMADALTHESMTTHEPAGSTLCVHSVVVEGARRRKQIGTRTLRAYVRVVCERAPNVEKIVLLCKRELVGFYEGCGFKMVGPSDVEHGADQWYEMSQRTAFARAVFASAAEEGGERYV